MSNSTYAGDPAALTCWKDIARYFGKGVRTVQRWERELGLPVRRPKSLSGNSPKSPVAADPRDLEVWMQSRWAVRAARESADPVLSTDRIALLSLEHHIQRSRELAATLKTTRQEHHDLVREICMAAMNLEQSCQQLKTLPDGSNRAGSNSREEQRPTHGRDTEA